MFLSFAAATLTLSAQQRNFFDDPIHTNALQKHRAGNPWVHFGFKPMLLAKLDVSHVPGYAPDSTNYYYGLVEHLVSDNLLVVEGKDYRFTADPLLDLQAGWSLQGRTRPNKPWDYRYNTRGFIIQGNVTDKFSFATRLYETQSIVPSYLDSLVREAQSMPGMGRVKFVQNNEFDYSMAAGYISYSPAQWLNLQFGHGTHFIGHGYHSMILSDYSAPNVYGQLGWYSADGKWNYHALWSGLRDLVRLPAGDAPEGLFGEKSMNSYYLSFKPVEWVEMGLVEQTIWPRYEPGVGTRPYDVGFLNPVMGVNTIRFGLGGENNVLWGLDAAFYPLPDTKIYGQYVVDDFEGPKAFQAGAQYFGPWKWLSLRAEYNSADEFMYAGGVQSSAFTHNGLPLAHPQGAGFEEVLGKIRVRSGRLTGAISLSRAAFSKSSADSLLRAKRDPTADVLPTEDGSEQYLADRGEQVRRYAGVEVGYIINFNTNLQISAGFTHRQYQAGPGSQTNRFYWIALRTAIRNRSPEF